LLYKNKKAAAQAVAFLFLGMRRPPRQGPGMPGAQLFLYHNVIFKP
jgi:hypothetical protein